MRRGSEKIGRSARQKSSLIFGQSAARPFLGTSLGNSARKHSINAIEPKRRQWNRVANVRRSVADCFCPIRDREKKHLSRGNACGIWSRARAFGTAKPAGRSIPMADPLPALVENSLQIAWDFLDGVGEIDDRQQTAEFLLRNIKTQILRGEERALVLSNRAIDSFRRRPQLVS